MSKLISEKTKIDPSEINQAFSDVNIKLLCCRYWVLEEWECIDLSVPFWRIYHNNIEGAKIIFNNKETILNKEIIIIIPPNTPFSTELKQNFNHKNESISGREFSKKDNLDTIREKNRVDHLFIHFSLGFPLDLVENTINVINNDTYPFSLINSIQDFCIDNTSFKFGECLIIKQLISYCILKLQDSVWKFATLDQRVFKSIDFIKKKYTERITNDLLADHASMAVNSFARLFKNDTGISIQQYIIKTKIEASCKLLHHSCKTIDEIAIDCGFSDRNHFAKNFKKVMNINPSYYKKRLTMV